MKKQIICILMIGIFLLANCQKKNTTEPPGNNNIHPQVDIPWPSLADSPWPMYHHDPQSTGRSPYIGPRKGKIKWKFTPGGSIYESIAIGPDSTIYFPAWNEPEGNKSALYALRPDGSLKWKVWLRCSQTMIIADGSVLASDATSIYFLNPDNGQITHQINFSNYISPYIQIGIDGNLYFTAEAGHLYAVNQHGVILWNIQTDHPFFNYNFPISQDGSTIYILTQKSSQSLAHLCAVNTATGEIKWKYPLLKELQDSISSPLTDSENNVYFGTFGVADSTGLYSISELGNLNWYYPGQIGEVPTIDYDGRLFFMSNHKLICLDYSGNKCWHQVIGPDRTTPICDREGVVYSFVNETVNVTAHNNKGELIWQIELPGTSSRVAAPAIGYDGTLYVGTYQGKKKSALYAIE